MLNKFEMLALWIGCDYLLVKPFTRTTHFSLDLSFCNSFHNLLYHHFILKNMFGQVLSMWHLQVHFFSH